MTPQALEKTYINNEGTTAKVPQELHPSDLNHRLARRWPPAAAKGSTCDCSTTWGEVGAATRYLLLVEKELTLQPMAS
jgi:hypothetical protein